MPDKRRWRRYVLASLFDAQMFACMSLSVDAVRARQPDIVAGMQKLFGETPFRVAVDSATNTPAYFRTRITMTREMIRAIAEDS